jgi:hypothetical protein
MLFLASLWSAFLRIPVTLIKTLTGAAKDTSGVIKDATGIRKDIVDTQLAHKKLEEYESRITPATLDDVKRYDLRTRRILEAAEDFARRQLPFVNQHPVLFQRYFAMKILCATIGSPLLLAFWIFGRVSLAYKIMFTTIWLMASWQILIMIGASWSIQLLDRFMSRRKIDRAS